MNWTPLNFGKHKDKTLPQVIFNDPDWFFWAINEGVFRTQSLYEKEALSLYLKARNIKIPFSKTHKIVEYIYDGDAKKFSHFEIVPTEQKQLHGSSDVIRKSVIDMSIPRQIAKFDKLGCKSLLLSLKRYLFGSESTQMTKKKCETFFNDNTNFKI